MSDHQQLGILPQLLIDSEQTTQVGVVEGRLHLIEDVKGARASDEKADQKGHGHQRAFPSREQREPFDLFARRPGLDIHPGFQPVPGISEQQLAFSSGKEPLENLPESVLNIVIGRLEDLLHPLVDVIDQREQVGAGLFQIGELFGQESMPGLQRFELLQRQRIDPSQGSQPPFSAA